MKLKITCFVFLVAVLIVGLTAQDATAPAGIKIKAEDAVQIRNIELAFTRAQSQLMQAEAQSKAAQVAIGVAQKDMNELMPKLQKDYKCEGCNLDFGTLTLSHPPKAESAKPVEKKERAAVK